MIIRSFCRGAVSEPRDFTMVIIARGREGGEGGTYVALLLVLERSYPGGELSKKWEQKITVGHKGNKIMRSR